MIRVYDIGIEKLQSVHFQDMAGTANYIVFLKNTPFLFACKLNKKVNECEWKISHNIVQNML